MKIMHAISVFVLRLFVWVFFVVSVLPQYQYFVSYSVDGKVTSKRRASENLEGSGLGVFEVLPRNLLYGDFRRPHKALVKRTDIHTEIRTGHRTNTVTQRYLYANLLGLRLGQCSWMADRLVGCLRGCRWFVQGCRRRVWAPGRNFWSPPSACPP